MVQTAGGLTAVPFTFLTGIMLDDEDKLVVLDWDRNREAWRPLDGADDGQSFVTTGLEAISGQVEAVLAVSVSFPIRDADVMGAFPAMPVARLSLENQNPNNHWSDAKQSRLAEEFLNVAIAIGGRGVTRIRLILAAQNSVAFRLGRAYDKRNLPEVVVYQFENGAVPPYPWGVLMPVRGVQRASILHNIAPAAA
jgi:SMODS-associated and fused to various effectors sensor domain